MPTADEARAELARRELARRAAARGDGSAFVGAVRNLGAARARSDTSPRPAPPRVRPAPPVRGQQRGATGEINGGLANVNRGIPLFDEISGATGAIGYGIEDAIQGRGFDPASAWERGMALQRGMEDDFRARRPLAATGLQSTGSAASSLVPVGQAANGVVQGGRLMGAARGGITAAAQGAIYGLTDRGSIDERIQAGQEGAGAGAVLGSVLGGALTRSRPGPPRVRTRSDDVRLLRESGVDMTPGDRIGGFARSLEDAAQSAPVLGPLIRGARRRGVVSMNVAAVQDALEPIGGRVSPDAPPGGEMVSNAADQIGAHLNAAAARIPRVRPAPSTQANIDAARNGLVDDAARARFDAAVNRYLDRGALARGELSGADIRRVESKLNEAARARARSTNTDDHEIGDALRLVVQEMKDVLAQSAPPGVAEDLQAGRLAWAKMVRVLKASENAGGDVFSAPQLASAVASSEANRSNVGRNQALGQEFSRAAKRVFGNRLPDSGTADRWGMGALGVLYGGDLMQGRVPVAGLASTAGLGALGAPYAMMGRNIAARVPETAGKATAAKALAELDALIAANPQVQQALASDRARLARLAGAASATATSERPGPPRR